MQEKKDLFGFENQGQNYDIYRPTYPDQFQQSIYELLAPENRTNYLDLATGTGQLFFNYIEQFSGIKIASDVSQKQIEVTKNKLAKLGDKIQSCFAIQCDAYELQEVLAQKFDPQPKFQLITIGQVVFVKYGKALHWFDVPLLFQYIKSNLLQDQNSILSIQSYYTQEIYLDYDLLLATNMVTEDFVQNKTQIVESVSIYKESFYETIKSYFECDRDNMSRSYEDYPFQKYFARTKLEQVYVMVPQTLEQLTKYMKTYSAYNTYVEKYPLEVDPADKLQAEIQRRYSLFKDQYGLIQDTPPLRMKVYFFQHLLQQ